MVKTWLPVFVAYEAIEWPDNFTLVTADNLATCKVQYLKQSLRQLTLLCSFPNVNTINGTGSGGFRAARLPGQATHAAVPLCYSWISARSNKHNWPEFYPGNTRAYPGLEPPMGTGLFIHCSHSAQLYWPLYIFKNVLQSLTGVMQVSFHFTVWLAVMLMHCKPEGTHFHTPSSPFSTSE